MIIAAVAAGGQKSALVCYEGGCASANMGGTGQVQLAQSLATHYHPRLYDVLMGHFAMLQAAGVTLFNYYCLDQLPTADGSAYPSQTYGVYPTFGMAAGRGDGSDGLYKNLSDIAGTPPGSPNLDRVVSPLAAAINAWNGVSSSNPTPTPAPATHAPKRHKSRGLKRGRFAR